jgi:hypothetical protein
MCPAGYGCVDHLGESRCRALGGLGDPCDPVAGCRDGFSCEHFGDAPACAAVVGLGADCTHAACDGSTRCGQNHTCVALPAIGDHCSGDGECPNDATCTPDARCTALPRVGESCFASLRCADGLCRGEGDDAKCIAWP